jgi:hypothetical protein
VNGRDAIREGITVKTMTTVVTLLFAAWLAGCAASGPVRVDCGGKLRPINPPAPEARP